MKRELGWARPGASVLPEESGAQRCLEGIKLGCEIFKLGNPYCYLKSLIFKG